MMATAADNLTTSGIVARAPLTVRHCPVSDNAAAVAVDLLVSPVPEATGMPKGGRLRLTCWPGSPAGSRGPSGRSCRERSANPAQEVSCNGAPVILRSHGAGSRGQQSSAAPLCRVEGVVEVASRPPALIVPSEALRHAADSYPIRSRVTAEPQHTRTCRRSHPWPAGVIPSSPSSPGRGALIRRLRDGHVHR